MTVAVESAVQGNLYDGPIGLLQQLLCPLYPLLKQVLVRGKAQRLFKQATEMKRAHAD